MEGQLFDRDEQAFAFVQMHVGDAGVEAEGIVPATEGPEVNVVDFLDAFDSEEGTSNGFNA